MYTTSDLKNGTKFIFNGQPHEVMSCQHSKQARAGGILRTRLKNLITGSIIDRTFKSGEKFEPAQIMQVKSQYLYQDGENFYFMDSATYDQFELKTDLVGDMKQYLKEGMEVEVYKFEDRPIGVSLPIKVAYTVTETEPNVKGDTAQGGTKSAVIETGAKINVPLFINQGDNIIVDTRDGKYIERA